MHIRNSIFKIQIIKFFYSNDKDLKQVKFGGFVASFEDEKYVDVIRFLHRQTEQS